MYKDNILLILSIKKFCSRDLIIKFVAEMSLSNHGHGFKIWLLKVVLFILYTFSRVIITCYKSNLTLSTHKSEALEFPKFICMHGKTKIQVSLNFYGLCLRFINWQVQRTCSLNIKSSSKLVTYINEIIFHLHLVLEYLSLLSSY